MAIAKSTPKARRGRRNRSVRNHMISVFFGDEDELFFEIKLLATDGLELSVNAMFDTGFDCWLAIVLTLGD